MAAPIAARDVSHRVARRPLLLCFSHLRWDFVYQRPQHLMTLAASDYEIWFIEEPVFETAGEPRLERRAVADHITAIVPVLAAAERALRIPRVQRKLLDRLLRAERRHPDVLWYYTPMALEFTNHLSADLCVYDNMDELSAFRHAPARLLELEQAVFARCDLVFCGGRSLYEAKRRRHPYVHAFPSSIDRAHFAQARSSPADPPDQRQIAHPRLGYFGVIDERMDLDLVAELAQSRPSWQFILLGPTAKIDAASLPRRPNLHWLGQRSYEALPSYLAHWDIGIMPFALNDATRYISPTKTPEFLAAGVPVVSAPIRDVVLPYGERGLVEIAHDSADWIACIESLLVRPHRSWLADADAFLADMSWRATWRSMHALMIGAARRRATRFAVPPPLIEPAIGSA